MPFQKGHLCYTPKLSDEHKRKIKEANTGKKRTKKMKERMSEIKKQNLYKILVGEKIFP